MAFSKEQIKQAYPLPAYNYRVTIFSGGYQMLPASTEVARLIGDATVISCSEVIGLSQEIETVTYRHGLSFITGAHILPGQIKEVQLSIKKGVTVQGKYFSDWVNLIYPNIIPAVSTVLRKRDVVIDLCDEKGQPVVRWWAMKALPTKLDAPTFDATTNEVAFENLHLVASQLRKEYI